MKVTVPMILGVVAGCLVTVAAFIPGWLIFVYPSTGYISYVSLFYGLTCSDYCQVYGYHEIHNYSNDKTRIWMIEFQVEVLLSIVIAFISSGLLFAYRRGHGGTTLVLVSVLLFVIEGLIIMVVCGRVTNATLAANENNKDNTDFYFHFPFSLVPAGIGGILQVIAAVIACVIRNNELNR